MQALEPHLGILFIISLTIESFLIGLMTTGLVWFNRTVLILDFFDDNIKHDQLKLL